MLNREGETGRRREVRAGDETRRNEMGEEGRRRESCDMSGADRRMQK